MEFFPFKKDIPFMSYSKLTAFISIATFLLSVLFLTISGLNFGVDFTGGTVMEVRYPQVANLTQIRSTLETNNFDDATVQSFGSAQDVMIRLPVTQGVTSAELSDRVMQTLSKIDPTVEKRRVEFVGPQVGEELINDGGLALLLVAIGIMIYLSIRFEWKFAVSAIIANLHDVVIILGFFAFFQWEFSLPVLAAVLAVLGYSVNESVVVFDRVRENFRKLRGFTTPQIIDNAITRTMSRTIITHFSTQLMVTSMLIFGGETLHYFALALTIGILFGIYSSVLVACPLVMWLGVTRADLMPVKKEGAEAGGGP